MIKHKISELTGTLLDLAVAIRSGVCFLLERPAVDFDMPEGGVIWPEKGGLIIWDHTNHVNGWWSPSTNPTQGQPIAERAGISVDFDRERGIWTAFVAGDYEPGNAVEDISELVARMRRFIGRAGDTIELPEIPNA
jgi:hypothetical protein